ncbi:hypothetical protein CEUSTIGMA_g5608.t1 [Chlamydomonas eustigma]|uniref:Sulfotransferase n=1 Tax=Chlamydomonas eustigma TaxID=1157962 RepID=A0A250X545_9CHLO|nr:hypothetical protein CEUSTIGMA_g5608.t1 [Chlamydomonas eustigma]|eukprot:GAX78166.1 hypothetical protein CEUSTIGMA_g5608.t1 [Chlamydomonas eustigma]
MRRIYNPIILSLLLTLCVVMASIWYLASHNYNYQGVLAEGGTEQSDVHHIRRALTKLADPDLVSNVATKAHGYIDSMKNPCWETGSRLFGGKQHSCLPHFYVSGWHSGAVALAKQLASHPNVAMDISSKDSAWNATHGFWTQGTSSSDASMRQYLDAIRSHALPRLLKNPTTDVVMDGSLSTMHLTWANSGRLHRTFQRSLETCSTQCMEGDKGVEEGNVERNISRACMSKCLGQARTDHVQAWRLAGYELEDVQLPLLMKAVYGDWTPKFVFLLRHPIHRIYSAYYGTPALRERFGNDLPGFTKFVGDQYGAYRDCLHNHSDSMCIHTFQSLSVEQQDVFTHCEQLFRGMHAAHLRIWLKFFPREAFLLVNSMDLFLADSRNNTIKEILDFLALPVPEQSSPWWGDLDRVGPRVTYTEHVGWVIPEGARRVMSKMYEPHNVALSQLLGTVRWLEWNEDTLVCPPSC